MVQVEIATANFDALGVCMRAEVDNIVGRVDNTGDLLVP